jgi:hypothetical protein
MSRLVTPGTLLRWHRRAIERVVISATATLGGMSFIESPEIAYLLGATRALAFHPPSRAAAAGPIAAISSTAR